MLTRLGEERAAAQVADRQVEEGEEKADEDVGTERAEHGLVRDATVVEHPTEGDRQRCRDEEYDRQEVGQPTSDEELMTRTRGASATQRGSGACGGG